MPVNLLIHVDYCLTPFTQVNNAAIIINDGKIQAVGGISAISQREKYHVIELEGKCAVPGFVDTHISGAAGFDCMHAPEAPERFAHMSRALARHGVTAFTPTTQTASVDQIRSVLKTLADLIKSGLHPGAVPLGIHLNGPFLSYNKRGAHKAEYLRDIDLDLAREFCEVAQGTIKIFTFAPELKGSVELTRFLVERGISPCMGHSEANEEQIMANVEAGCNRCLHLYNGMEPLRQRRIGLAAIALIDDRIWVELIPDGIHSHWGMLRLACRCKNKSKVIGISNATEAAGLEDGCYHLGDQTIFVRNGLVNLKDGTIAGSTHFLDENFRNLLIHAELSESDAVTFCSYNPLRSIGITDRGEIKPGRQADITLLDCRTKEVVMTIIAGRIAYMDREYLNQFDLPREAFTENPDNW
ncbi:MAG: N-acetylglucosamine-6-phosphate deacetylase [Lentisphaerae bacterium]|nr:MAG: N-acetylglucosamine-6-phosphate deacetylase [Lentisphaerota bacterium]